MGRQIRTPLCLCQRKRHLIAILWGCKKQCVFYSPVLFFIAIENHLRYNVEKRTVLLKILKVKIILKKFKNNATDSKKRLLIG